MTLLTTGPIENNVNSENNTRLTQQATVKIDNWSGQDASTVLIEGYYMNEERVQYVCDLLKVMPHQVITRNYFADFDAFEFFSQPKICQPTPSKYHSGERIARRN
ncbi:hypothetical protein MHB77_13610 [Paenibacillus sp. FSL K6-3166]|uniref:hypothetical protein n=1 Tax=unclassified Paenibacillus TaxID=185978 RepID=UPI000BA09BF9|nr:hypothetical protein [Paenibacillus sp. VTT E-133291]OZQ86592.1 hypothetical protein CA598_17975 [Paenibacillus sp. VTT E-133291]